MPIPALDADGLLPPGRHTASVAEVKAAFVDPFGGSASRMAIFTGWRMHRESLQNVVPGMYQWIDGSFVTSKPDPGDIDVVTFIDGVQYDAMPDWRRALGQSLMLGHGNQQFWNVDSFAVPVVPATHPTHAAYAQAEQYWDDLWSKVRGATRQKGYLEVAL